MISVISLNSEKILIGGMNSTPWHRQSIRLRAWDYSSTVAYFVTLCIQNRERPMFGEVKNGKMWLNNAGRLIHETWMELPNRFPTIALDAMVIMPNHLHGIVFIQKLQTVGIPTRDIPTLGHIIGAFKSITTVRYVAGVKQNGWPEFYRKIWHWNYYDSIIRHTDSLNRVRRYIELNPSKWDRDRENPLLKHRRG